MPYNRLLPRSLWSRMFPESPKKELVFRIGDNIYYYYVRWKCLCLPYESPTDPIWILFRLGRCWSRPPDLFSTPYR